jgi:hypothetical protein
MKANELRIGNLVNIGEQPNILELVDFADMYENNTLVHYQPIPLAEDWLLKFGFEKVELNYQKAYSDDLAIIIAGDGLLLVSQSGTDDNYENPYCHALIYIKSVHQLQNLYFALTGTELELKNEKN